MEANSAGMQKMHRMWDIFVEKYPGAIIKAAFKVG